MKDKRYGNIPFYNALRKYGLQNVEWEVLSKHETLKDAELMEIKLISETPLNYNVASGGMVMIYNQEIRKRISEGQKGKPKTEICKKRISETLKVRFQDENERRLISERTKNAMWTKQVRENYLQGRKKINLAERSQKRKETEELKRIELLKILSENYTNGMKLTELRKLTGISYDFIRRNKLRWLNMQEV